MLQPQGLLLMQDEPLPIQMISADMLVLGMDILASLLLLAIGSLLLIVMVLYIIDVTQTHHAVRRNYPVIGRFRYLFEHLGEFFRQYFFAMDREEMPFNRAQRSWIYRASKNISNTLPFGSTRDLTRPGNILFVNHPYPKLAEDETPPPEIVIGPQCENPYVTSHFFHISGMSYGSISKVAVQALSRGAAQAGCWLNTGEGGLSPYHLEGECDLIFQIGTAKYGVREADGSLSDARLREMADLPAVKMFEIKLSQGAKPGMGGLLPAGKVTEEVAQIRGIPVGQKSVSPHRHRDIADVSQLLDIIARIRDVTGKPVGFKNVVGSERALDEWIEEVLKRGPDSAPDFITIDSSDGGSGAAPMPLLDSVGLTLRESLPMTIDRLLQSGLRERIRVATSGKLVNPSDVAWALCMGADFINSARGFMFALGCIQAMQCHRNTCPTGVTTHNLNLQQGLNPKEKSVRVANLARNMEAQVAMIAHSCGVSNPRELNRTHARVVQANGFSVSLQTLHPLPPMTS